MPFFRCGRAGADSLAVQVSAQAGQVGTGAPLGSFGSFRVQSALVSVAVRPHRVSTSSPGNASG